MKRLDTYLEGLLNKSDKTSANSSIIDKVNEYIETYILPTPQNEDMTYTISGETITLINSGNYKCEIGLIDVDEFINKFEFKKILLRGSWTLYGDGMRFSLPVTIECDKRLYIRPYYGVGKITTIKDINIKAKHLIVQNKIKLNNTQIQADVVTTINPEQLVRCKVQTKQIMISPSESAAALKLIAAVKKPLIKYISNINIEKWDAQNPEIINALKDIDPSISLKFNKYNIDDIVIENVYNRKSKDVLVFTKTPKSFILKYPDIYEMKNGWYAIWLGDLRQFVI